MTIVIGVACLIGLTVCLRVKTTTRPLAAAGVIGLFALLQWTAFRISLIPYIGRR